MFLHTLAFEWRYYLRQPSFYVVGLMLFLACFFVTASDNIQIGAGGEVFKNSPYAIVQTLLTMGLIAMFAVVNFVGSTAIRNQQSQMEELIYVKPLSPLQYQLGRFLGSFLVVLTLFALVPLGHLLGSFMPWVDASRFGPVSLWHYLKPYLLLAAPTLLFLSVLFYAIAQRFRSMMALYLTAVTMMVLYSFAGQIASQPQYREMAALLDPFGLRSAAQVARYWTIDEKNTISMGLEGLMLLNRALWFGVSLAILTLCGLHRQPMLTRKREAKKAKVHAMPLMAPMASLVRRPDVSSWSQFWVKVGFEVRQVLFTAPFYILGVLSLINLVGPMFMGDLDWYGTSNWPLTQDMVEMIVGATSLLMIIVLVFYSGEIVWRERASGMGDIIDATPASNLVFLGSKFVALMLVLVLLYSFSMLTTLAFQLIKGQTNLELAQYAISLGFKVLLPLMMSAVLAFFLQVLAPNKYAGMGLFVGYYLISITLSAWGFGHSLNNFGASPIIPYSDMNGYGWGLLTHGLYMVYWGAFSVLLFLLSYGLYRRGPEVGLKTRMAQLGYQLGFGGRAVAGLALSVFVVMGGYLFYQTTMVNSYVTAEEYLDNLADYEKRFKQYNSLPELSPVAVKGAFDIFPEDRRIEAKVEMRWQNRASESISRMLVSLPEHTDPATVKFDIPGASFGELDSKLPVGWLTFAAPIAPGAEVSGTITLVRDTNGIAENNHDWEVVENGTFINNFSLLPVFGYQNEAELSDRHERQKRGLAPKDRANKLEDERFYNQNFFGPQGTFIDFEATVSTSADQTALVPGYLTKSWQENGRNYFHYQMDSPMVNFFSIVSGRYAVKKEEYKGINIEVYYHPAHPWNVDRMIESVRDSIDYFSAAFGPYQHRQMRIMEYPGYRSFAQSFANTVPYSERIGFITDLRDPDKIDPVYYVTAHEVAHQWWGHQVGAADVQGSAVISESLSQYAALMVMEKKYGSHMLRKFLRYELDRYLRGRSSERIGEMPLLRSENQQYIHYQKGAVIMMAIKDVVGEEQLNANLASFAERFRYRTDPFPTTLDLVSYLKQDLSDEQQAFVDSSFNDITLYDLRLEDVQLTELDSGKVRVDLTIHAGKLTANNEGKELQVEISERVDIGLFAADPDTLTDENDVLLLEKHPLKSGENQLSFELDKKPTFVGVDPFVKLVDRDSKDNIFKL
ncbi:ABC transporter permease/M1 family aminopeptidase [Shewanella sp.]|uniref:ABC transporter permease/M1 family aminopeptidase n=1 Tax=Shewanella sp. TaxID=50422 RepID=UPI0035693ED9